MKLKNICIAVVALALAAGMTACGGSASSAAASSTSEAASASTAVSEAASSEAASSEAASSEAASSEAASSEAASSEATSSEAASTLPPKFNAHSVHNRIAKGRCTLFCAAAFLIAQKDLNALRVRYGHNQRNDFFRDTGSSADAPVSHFMKKDRRTKPCTAVSLRLRSKLPSIIFQELRGSEQGRRQR